VWLKGKTWRDGLEGILGRKEAGEGDFDKSRRYGPGNAGREALGWEGGEAMRSGASVGSRGHQRTGGEALCDGGRHASVEEWTWGVDGYVGPVLTATD
jgi:hypothetical protein